MEKTEVKKEVRTKESKISSIDSILENHDVELNGSLYTKEKIDSMSSGSEMKILISDIMNRNVRAENIRINFKPKHIVINFH